MPWEGALSFKGPRQHSERLIIVDCAGCAWHRHYFNDWGADRGVANHLSYCHPGLGDNPDIVRRRYKAPICCACKQPTSKLKGVSLRHIFRYGRSLTSRMAPSPRDRTRSRMPSSA